MNDNFENNFGSVREVKWCPGCGNYAILATVQKVLSSSGFSNDKIVFISGIGCAGRFPYYINSFGFHTLHGRAPAVATGLALARPDLNIWIVIGDGDGFSIGLGHILHLVRRNLNVKVLFINNKIYALTKGQYSPTSNINAITKSSPIGSFEEPINPLLMVLSAGVTFAARCIDNDINNLKKILHEAINHTGTAFIEILQNCITFNNDIFSNISNNDDKLDKIIYLEHNKKLIFGKNNNKKLIFNKRFSFEISTDTFNTDFDLIHDVKNDNILQIMLAKLTYKDIPYPLGIFKSFEKETYEYSFSQKYKDNNNKFLSLDDFFLKI